MFKVVRLRCPSPEVYLIAFRSWARTCCSLRSTSLVGSVAAEIPPAATSTGSAFAFARSPYHRDFLGPSDEDDA